MQTPLLKHTPLDDMARRGPAEEEEAAGGPAEEEEAAAAPGVGVLALLSPPVFREEIISFHNCLMTFLAKAIIKYKLSTSKL